jgi:hypothetical protein
LVIGFSSVMVGWALFETNCFSLWLDFDCETIMTFVCLRHDVERPPADRAGS